MSWKCPQCGVENDKNADVCAGMCGFMRLSRIVLTAASGKKIRFNMNTEVGRAGLQKLGGEDAKFASQPQFELLRDVGKPGWLVKHKPSATNPTCLNSNSLGADPQPLHDGDVISIGPKRLMLQVCLERDI